MLHKAKVITQRISELDVRDIRLDCELNGPGDFGHAIGTLRENPRLPLIRNPTVLDGNIYRSLARKLDRHIAAGADVFV